MIAKRLATVVGFLLLVFGFAAAGWPAPLFTLNEPYLTWYIVNVLQTPTDKDRSAGAALPFAWLFLTMPIGVLAMALGVPLLHWGQRK